MKSLHVDYSPRRYRLAWGLLLLLLFVVVFGHHLMPYGIDKADKIPYLQLLDPVTGHKKPVAPPFAPSWQHWLGTDHRGFDLLSLLLNGAKYTLGFAFFATVLRFLLALPFGLFSGATGRGRSVIAFFNVVVSAVPPLVFIFPTLFGMYAFLSPDQTGVLLFAMIVVIGVPQISNQFAERSAFYAGRLYIEAARTMGASTPRIIGRHILPHMRSELLFAFLSDFVGVLFLIGQLSILSIFLGGGESFLVDDGPPAVLVYLSLNGEWGSLIAYGAKYIRSYWWIVAGSGAFFAGAVLILQFFSHELQRYLGSTAARHQAKPLRQNRALQATIGGVVAVCLATVFLLPNHAPNQKKPPETSVSKGSAIPALSTSAASLPSEDDILRMNYQTAAMNFMEALQTKWDTAVLEMPEAPYNPTRKYVAPKEPIAPFDQWMQALKSRKLTYSNIGKISDGPTITLGWGGEFRTKQVEVYLHDADNGKEEVWYLYLDNNTRNYRGLVVGGKPLTE